MIDVAVLGGGLAGLATALKLAEMGHSVTVVDDDSVHRPTLGESLEFSAPSRLGELGLDSHELFQLGLGYPKLNVCVSLVGHADFEIWPPGWFGQAPFFCSNEALHIDRAAIDRLLRARACETGVLLLNDRVTGLEVARPDRISAALTSTGRRVEAPFYVDATGHRTRLVGRALSVGRRIEGEQRVAYYARLPVAPWIDATLFQFWPLSRGRKTWGWIIPLNRDEVSVGINIPSDEVRADRARGCPGPSLFWSHVDDIPELTHCGPDQDILVRSTAYQPYSHERASGANWVLVGDAAALVSPITSSGVAASLRGADTAARLIDGHIRAIPGHRLRRASHHHSTVRMVSTVNIVTDRVLFNPGVWGLIGGRLAVFAFAAPTLVVHSWSNRFRLHRRRALIVHRSLTGLVRSLALLIGRATGAKSGQRPNRA